MTYFGFRPVLFVRR